ncbi:hypothetical protein D022_1273A, partial [Vibrio parahaemolyticus 12310]
MPSLRF